MYRLLDSKSHIGALQDVAALLMRHRHLTWAMTKREITDRYAGQVLGSLWAVGHPLMLMCIYVFVFAVVFRQKIGGTAELPLDYTTYLLAGLIPWLCFQESMIKSASVIFNNAGLVKQVVFPVDILPIKGVIASFITQLVSTTILVGYVLFTNGSLLWTYALIPVVFLLQIVAMTGVAYLLSALGVFFRDLKDFVQVFGTIGIFLIPVVYLPNQVPKIFVPVILLNPFSYLIWCYQDVFYYGRIEHPEAWLIVTVISFGSLVAGYRLFRRLSPTFGNLL